MIPKKIHYCWYSGEEKDEQTKRCIDSWYKHLPDYEIIEWNASNCNIEEPEFTKTAFEAGKWAQVADYFRLKVLYDHGGIYLDADVLVNKPFDELLMHNAFFPIEGYDYVINAVMGSVCGFEILKKMMRPYLNAKYESNDQILSFMHYMTQLLLDEYGFLQSGYTQYLREDIAVLSSNRLLINVDDGANICEHLYAGAWLDEKYKEGVTYKSIVLKKYFYNMFGRPDIGAEENTGNIKSGIIKTGLLQSDEFISLISTVKKGLEYIKSNPEQFGELADDINEAVDAVAGQLEIGKPEKLKEKEDIPALENWLVNVTENTEDIGEEESNKIINSLTKEIDRIRNEDVTLANAYNIGAVKFYSTCGEDALLLRVFFNRFTRVMQSRGIYVDVGAHHPIAGSNTYALHKIGWSGINVEANPSALPAFERERPNDINLNCAVGKNNGEIVFYLFGNEGDEFFGQSSTTDEEFKKRIEEKQGAVAKEVRVQEKRLDTILSEHLEKNRIELLNVDVENKELDVLQSNNWELYRPLVIAVEIHPQPDGDFNIRYNLENSSVIKFLEEQGYICFSLTLHTWFFYDTKSEKSYMVRNWTTGI